jgi:hypothetical protein
MRKARPFFFNNLISKFALACSLACSPSNQPTGPAARNEHASSVFDGKLIVAGGSKSTDQLNDVWISENGATWQQRTASAPWRRRDGLWMNAFNDKLWVFGGSWTSKGFSIGNYHTFSVRQLDDIWNSTDGIAWSKVLTHSPWGERSGMQVVAFKDRLWIVGGTSTGTLNGDLWSSADGVKWNCELANAPWGPRESHVTVVFDQKLYVIGGMDGNWKIYEDVWVTDDGTNWRQPVSKAPWKPRFSFAAAVLGDSTFLFGGEYLQPPSTPTGVWPPSTYFNDVWMSKDGTTWNEIQPNAAWAPRSQHTAATFKDRLWLVGGSSETLTTTEVWSSTNGIQWNLESSGAF